MYRRGSFRTGIAQAGVEGGPGSWWPPYAGQPGGPGWWPPYGAPLGGPGSWWPAGGPGPWGFGRGPDPRAHYHPNMLILRLRPSAGSAATFARIGQSGVRAAPNEPGLATLELLQRGGRIKRVRPVSREIGAEVHEAPVDFAGPARALHILERTARHRAASEAAEDPQAGVSVVELEFGVDANAVHAQLADDPHVEFVDRVPVRYLEARRGGGEPPPAGARSVPPPGPVLWNLQKIQWAQARALPNFDDAGGVKVAVLDTGVDDAHPDLQGRIAGYVYQHPDIPDASGRDDLVGHGTHVSGIIGAGINNGIGINGICAPQIFVWKIFTDQTTFDPSSNIFTYFVDPVMYHRALADVLRQKMQVVNLSIGGPGRPDANESQLFASLIKAGIPVVAAMGNERQAGSPTSYPAAIPGVIAVGATGIDDSVASFSNRGNHISVCAPGVAIWSTLPTYAGQDGFYAVAGPNGEPVEGKPIRRETNYDAWDGTSMATPHVTAAVALRLAQKPGRSPAQLRADLQASADKVAGMGNQAFTPDYGAGRINLLRLLQLP